jgi:hypothetical protein
LLMSGHNNIPSHSDDTSVAPPSTADLRRI